MLQEAALDADKLFLAAIDKFDAMMSKSNEYAPDGKKVLLLVIDYLTIHLFLAHTNCDLFRCSSRLDGMCSVRPFFSRQANLRYSSPIGY